MFRDLFLFGGTIVLGIVVFNMTISMVFYGIAALLAGIGWVIEKLKGE